jgi:transcriptional regulator with XRE-family HTH domain
MTFGERITMLRKQFKWSQEDLAKKVGTSAPIIGRYERDEIKPSIEVAKKIADALDTTVDYLLGGSAKFNPDKKTLKRLEELELLEDDKKKMVLDLIDTYIRDAKIRKAHAA